MMWKLSKIVRDSQKDCAEAKKRREILIIKKDEEK